MNGHGKERTIAQARWPVLKANGAGLHEQSESQTGVRLRTPGNRDVGQSRLARLDEYLVDPASSDMLVSKIKPCRCKYELT